MSDNNTGKLADKNTLITSIVPWLTVTNSVKAVEFYKSAFGAIETYRLEDPDGGLVVKLSIDKAEFWVSGEADTNTDATSGHFGEDAVRMILTVSNPEAFFAKALIAGATEIFAVGVDHGWKLGRLADPFGLHWEIGHPVQE